MLKIQPHASVSVEVLAAVCHRGERFDSSAAVELLVTWSGPIVAFGPADPILSLGAADGFCDFSKPRKFRCS